MGERERTVETQPHQLEFNSKMKIFDVEHVGYNRKQSALPCMYNMYVYYIL